MPHPRDGKNVKCPTNAGGGGDGRLGIDGAIMKCSTNWNRRAIQGPEITIFTLRQITVFVINSKKITGSDEHM